MAQEKDQNNERFGKMRKYEINELIRHTHIGDTYFYYAKDVDAEINRLKEEFEETDQAYNDLIDRTQLISADETHCYRLAEVIAGRDILKEENIALNQKCAELEKLVTELRAGNTKLRNQNYCTMCGRILDGYKGE